MCQDCGCNQANHEVFHHHHHKTVEIEKNVLSQNDEYAQENRKWFQENKIFVLNLISSPGSGKTLLLEKTLQHFSSQFNVQALVGDQQTNNDALRLMNKGARVKQINTYSSCHLDAHMISHEIGSFITPDCDLLFIENVGNLVCPAAFDLGENCRIALLSTPEGEDKPIKYPVLFHDAHAIVLTKMDLQPHLDWSFEQCLSYVQQVNVKAPLFKLSSKTGEGLDEWYSFIESHVKSVGEK